MFLSVSPTGVVSFEDAQNFRSFKVVVTMRDATLETLGQALQRVAVVSDRDTAWVSEQALRSWPDHAADSAWQSALSAMIDKARPHGWIDDVNRRIRAHIEWPA